MDLGRLQDGRARGSREIRGTTARLRGCAQASGRDRPRPEIAVLLGERDGGAGDVMIKVDMHMHTGEDPKDGLRYPATALIDRAVELGYGAIAITLHCQVIGDERVFAYAREKGLL